MYKEIYQGSRPIALIVDSARKKMSEIIYEVIIRLALSMLISTKQFEDYRESEKEKAPLFARLLR